MMVKSVYLWKKNISAWQNVLLVFPILGTTTLMNSQGDIYKAYSFYVNFYCKGLYYLLH